MAISGGDGSIILTTKVDTSGISKGSVSIKSALQGVNSAVTKVKNSLSAFREQKVTLATLTQAIKDQEYVVNSLSVDYAKLVAAGKGESAQAQKLKANLDAATAEMNEMRVAAQTLGAKGSTAFGKIGTSLRTLIGYFFGIQTIYKAINFAKETSELYKVQIQNETKLATVMRERIGATDEQIQQMLDLASAEQQVGIIGDEVQLAGLQQVATFARQQDTLETLLPAMNNLIAQQYGYEATTESARNVANLMGKALQGQTGALTRVGITFNKAQERVLKYGNESERAAVLAEVITDNVGEMNKALASTDIGRQRQLANTMGDIKEQFGAAFTQIAIVFLPMLQTLANVLAKVAAIARTAAQNIANAFGKSSDNASTQNQAIQSSVKNQEALTDAVEDTAKAQKKSLAGFDEINTITENSASSQEDIADLTDTTGSGGLFSGGIQSVSGDIDAELATIMGYVGFALAAIGIILICFGQIGWGIGFIIAGATAFMVSQASLSNGATEDVKNTMNAIIAGISLLALILGIILVATGGSLPLGIGLIVVGAAGLATEIALNWNAIKENIQKFFTENGGLIAGVSLALLVIGVLLCFAQIWGLGIGLIAAGAAGLVAVVALNWNAIKETVVNVFNAVIDWIKTYGLLVLGIILCLTGVGIPLGIALIIKWAKDGAEKGVPLATAIVDKVKEIWKAVKDFWNKYIAPVFTGKFWLDLAIKCANGLISGFENGVNGIIGLFEKMINWIVGQLNKISFDVPDWVPIIGGKTFGFNIPEATFKRISIPRLAQGAVIPPNREFLAVLGDQKQGRNLEAPESLLREIYAEGNAETNALLQQLIQVMQKGMTVNVDGQQLMRINRDAETRSGRQTVTGGFANAY